MMHRYDQGLGSNIRVDADLDPDGGGEMKRRRGVFGLPF
jgi:hypothetical protein